MIKTRNMHFPGLLFITHPVLIFMMLNLVPLGISAFPSQSADDPTHHSTEDRGLSSLIVQLEQSLHFDAPDGQIVVVPPGAYLVEPVTQGESRLVFWHEQGKITIQATRTAHGQDINSREANLIQEDANQDVYHVAVFLPGGKALEAVGSVSGIKTRGPFRVTQHYRLDQATGRVQFGDGREGRRVPRSTSNLTSQYRHGSEFQDNELAMLQIQSAMSQRQRSLTLAQNLLNSLNGRFQLEEAIDRPGDDYAQHKTESPESCKTRCAGDGNCQAFTFVKSAQGATQGQCFLKRSEPTPVDNHCCVSGTRSTAQEKILRNIGR